MNELTEHLARKAGVNLSPFQFSGIPIKYEVTETVLEKFAELIVKETLQVARAGIEYGDSMEDAVYKYFGVEE